MAKEDFFSKQLCTAYYVIDEKWIDKDTYVLVFQDMKDSDGDTFHIEVEYHKDENKITWSRVYEHETIEETFYKLGVQHQVEKYILQRVGVLRKGSILHEQNITITLKVDVPLDMSVGELSEWFDSLKFEVVHTMTPKDEKARIIEVTRKGELIALKL